MKANRQAKVYTVMLESEQLYEEAFAAAVLPDSTNAASSPIPPGLPLFPLVLFCVFLCVCLPSQFSLFPCFAVFTLFYFVEFRCFPVGFRPLQQWQYRLITSPRLYEKALA